MSSAPAPPLRYVCPRCGARGEAAVRCARDGAAMLVASPAPDVPPPESGPRPWVDEVNVAVTVGGLSTLLFVGTPSIAGRVVAVALAALAGHGLYAARRDRRRAEAPALPLAPTIRDAAEGTVRLRGRVVGVAGAQDPEGMPRVVFAVDAARGPGAARGAAFDLEDGSGARALVRAQHVWFTNELPLGPRFALDEGVEVEVRGAARWTVDAADGALRGLRAEARALEVWAEDGRALEITLLSGALTPRPPPEKPPAPLSGD